MSTRALALATAALAAAPLPLRAQERTLADVVRRALEVHPSVAAAASAADAARAGVAGERAARLPGLSFAASAVRFQEPMVVAPIHGFDPQSLPEFDRTLVQGGADLAYTVFDGGRRTADVARARALERASLADLADARAALVQRTAEAYLALLTARDVLAAQQARERALEAELARVRRFLDEGAAPRLDLLRAEAELASTRAAGEEARRGAELAAATLAAILDEPAEVLAEASLVEPELPAPWPGTPAGGGVAAPAGAARQGAPTSSREVRASAPDVPDDAPPVAAALGRAAAAEAEASAARSAWLPSLQATAGYALYAGADAAATGEWRGGVRVSYPVFTGGARAAAIAAAEARARAMRAQADVVRERVGLELDRARTAEAEARARMSALEAARDSFEELVRVERLALDEGSGVQSDRLRAEAGLFDAATGLARARRAVLQARIAWARAAGALGPDWIEDLFGRQP